MWQADAFLDRLYEEAEREREFRRAGMAPGERKAFLRRTLADTIGHFPRNDENRPRLLERIECDGYVRERVELSATPGLSFAAYMLIPAEAGRSPACWRCMVTGTAAGKSWASSRTDRPMRDRPASIDILPFRWSSGEWPSSRRTSSGSANGGLRRICGRIRTRPVPVTVWPRNFSCSARR